MELDFKSNIEQPDEVIMQELTDGQSILLNTQSEHYFGLDEIGNVFYKCIVESKTIQEAFHTLNTTYDTDPETLKADLQEFINNLVKRNLLKIK
jgi:hypothetical protein